MADPLAIAAIIGLAYTGSVLSQNVQSRPVQPSRDNTTVLLTDFEDSVSIDAAREQGAVPAFKQEQDNFAVIAPTNYPAGDPVRNFRDRPYVSGKMNNLAPAAKVMVGPGLGINADTPAYGGYQQLYRVNPENVGAYKLTTLPGRSGPGEAVVKASGIVGQLTHNKPETTAYLPSRYPTVPGRGQGQGGSLNGFVERPRHEHTKRPTVRAETGLRTDGLGYAPAKSTVSALQRIQDPTRNKGDYTVNQVSYNDRPQPGISSHHGAYTNAPEVLRGSDAIRAADRRGMGNRYANPGRMNVRDSATQAGGRITTMRSDSNRKDGWVGHANDARGQQYSAIQHQDNNSFKGTHNPYARGASLNIAKKQLSNNPLALTISQ